MRAGKNSSYFDLGNEWNVIQDRYGFTDSDMFEYFNKPALDDALAAGKTIRFSHDPREFRRHALGDEWDYLKEVLKLTDEDLVYRGGFWYVK